MMEIVKPSAAMCIFYEQISPEPRLLQLQFSATGQSPR